MFSVVLIFLALQTCTLTGIARSFPPAEHESGSVDSNTDVTKTKSKALSALSESQVSTRAATFDQFSNWFKTSEKHAAPVSATKDSEFVFQVAGRSSTRHIRQPTRVKRATSKFTGLVVGASKDGSLMQSVSKLLNNLQSTIWSYQSQFSKPFIGNGPAVLLGAFNSDFRTNFHGLPVEANLRRSNDYSISDLNSVTTLLILQCLVEATLYGSAASLEVSNLSIAMESLKTFSTHTYPRGSSILTMWPEKLLSDSKGWLNVPENIIGAQVKDGTTFNQLQQLARSCNCEPAKSGLQTISETPLCKEHFSTPLSELFKDTATPPDFLTSFSNLALGALLHLNVPVKTLKMFKAEAEIWYPANNDSPILLEQLKSKVIIIPATHRQVSTTDSNTATNGTVSIAQKEQMKANGKEKNIAETNSNNVITRSTVSSNETQNKKEVGDQNHNRTARSVPVSSLNINTTASFTVNQSVESSESEQVSEEVETRPVISTSAFPAITSSNSIEDSTQLSKNEISTTHVPTTQAATVQAPTKEELITYTPTTQAPTTQASTTQAPTTQAPTTQAPTTQTPTQPSTVTSTTLSTAASTTSKPTTQHPAIKNSMSRANQIISSESYYALRNYLDDAVSNSKEDVILIPSWISDDDDKVKESTEVKKLQPGSVIHNGQMYHSYNNVNLMTTATVLHAIVVSSMSQLINITYDIMLQEIVISSLRLLTWFMNNPGELVTIVTLSEFPSRYQLYWATSRIAFQLNSKEAQSSRIFQFAEMDIISFTKVLRDKMTFSILQSITDGGLGQDGKTRVYIDDCVGSADIDDKGNKLVNGDDRLFTSALAINTLIATWTVKQDNGLLEFVKDIGDPVRIAINSLANYVSGAVTDQGIPNLNAFMSEQIKDCETLPARYPANIITSMDGQEVNPAQPTNNLRFGVKGYVPKEEYQKLLNSQRFGFKSRGGSLDDLNSSTSFFRFWSSPAYTKAVAFLAIAQAANLDTDVNS